jgi:hypothetical protein
MFSTMYSNDVYLLETTNARYTSASSFKEIDVLYDYDVYANDRTLQSYHFKTIASRVAKILDVAKIEDWNNPNSKYVLGVLIETKKGSNRILCRATDLLYSDRRLYNLTFEYDVEHDINYKSVYYSNLLHSRYEDSLDMIEYLLSTGEYRISSEVRPLHKKIQDLTFVDNTYVSEPTVNRFYLQGKWQQILAVTIRKHTRSNRLYNTCTKCSHIVNDTYKHNEDMYCNTCYNTTVEKCDACHTDYKLTDLVGVYSLEDRNIRSTYLDLDITRCCKSCWESLIISCEHCRCSDVIDFDKLRYAENSSDRRMLLMDFARNHENYHNVLGRRYCTSCADLKLQSYLASPFRYRRLPIKLATKSEYNRYIGIESEVITCYDDSEDYVSAVGEPDYFEVIEDGSLNSGGVEFVTHKPIIGNTVVEALDSLEQTHREDDNYTDESCGIHIHMNALDFNFTEIQSLLMIMSRLQGYIYRGLPSNRTGNTYCKEIPMSPRKISRMRSLTHLVNEYYKGANTNLTDNKYNDARYFGTNIHARFYLGTIEFRYHEGSVYSRPIKEWIQFLNRIMTTATKLHRDPVLCSRIISDKIPTMDILKDITGVFGAEYIDRRIDNN